MIVQTKQQRKNTLEALNVMWPSVPPENVADLLQRWRVFPDFGVPSCKTIACFGGWCAWWPSFMAQGVKADVFGEPTKGAIENFDVGDSLFGDSTIFKWRNAHEADHLFRGTDHELVTHRLQWLLKNSKVSA